MNVTPIRSIYQIKISLKGAKPKIWRRILVRSDMRLNEFHEVLQYAMSWTDSHLHQFRAGETYFSSPIEDDDFGLETEDENKYRIDQLLHSEKDAIKYEYDFGDGWEHKVVLEKILPFQKEMITPLCIKGEGACPPEDCGGIWGYQDLLIVLKDPNHPEHEEMMDWTGGDIDPNEFDIDYANAMLETMMNKSKK